MEPEERLGAGVERTVLVLEEREGVLEERTVLLERVGVVLEERTDVLVERTGVLLTRLVCTDEVRTVVVVDGLEGLEDVETLEALDDLVAPVVVTLVAVVGWRRLELLKVALRVVCALPRVEVGLMRVVFGIAELPPRVEVA